MQSASVRIRFIIMVVAAQTRAPIPDDPAKIFSIKSKATCCQTMQGGKSVDNPIREGEILYSPSVSAFAATFCRYRSLVIERNVNLKSEMASYGIASDVIRRVCRYLHVSDIVAQLPPSSTILRLTRHRTCNSAAMRWPLARERQDDCQQNSQPVAGSRTPDPTIRCVSFAANFFAVQRAG